MTRFLLSHLNRIYYKLIAVEDCAQHHYDGWWDLISPCFKQKVQNKTIYNPELCQPLASREYQQKIHVLIDHLNSTYHNASNEVPRFPSVTNDVPEDYREFCPGDFDSMLTYLKIVVTITPPFLIKSADQLGVPISTIFLCYMHTEQGRKFFANPMINEIMRNIVNAYGEMLASPESLTVFNDRQYGWLSKCGKEFINYCQFLPHDPTDKYYGFTSFNDFFTR